MVISLLILAFCDSVRCHGDNHLDLHHNSRVKWAGGAENSIRFSRLPGGSACHDKASWGVLGSSLVFSGYFCLLLPTCP